MRFNIVISVVIFIMCSCGSNLQGSNEVLMSEAVSERSFYYLNNSTKGSEIVQKIIEKQCAVEYTLMCIKLDVLKILESLDEDYKYQILPGITIHKKNSTAKNLELTAEFVRILTDNGEQSLEYLDDYLVAKVDRNLGLYTISLDSYDPKGSISFKQIGEDLVSTFLPSSSSTGRFMKASKLGRKKGSGNLAWWAAGTMATLGATSLMMLTGKALMMSLLALMLSAGSAWRQFGGRLGCGGALIDVSGRQDVLGTRKTLEDEQILNAYRAQVKVPGGELEGGDKTRLLTVLVDLLSPQAEPLQQTPEKLKFKRHPANPDYFYVTK